jgi:subtilisin family serine protease
MGFGRKAARSGRRPLHIFLVSVVSIGSFLFAQLAGAAGSAGGGDQELRRNPARTEKLLETLETRSIRPKPRKLDSRVAELTRIQEQRGGAAALARARELGLETKNGDIRLVLEAMAGERKDLRASLKAAGGAVELEFGHLVQVLIPPSALEEVASHRSVRFMRPPARSYPDAVAGEGVAASGANAWHAAGWTGAGVKIGIIDGGFAGLDASVASGDLPASGTLVDAGCAGGPPGPGNHGTQVAEIVHEMAPGAQLYLICRANSELALDAAKNYAKAQGISIISQSVSSYNVGRGDGSGPVGATVADARANGILWANSAGNHGQTHWTGAFSSPDADILHDWAPGDEFHGITVPPGATAFIALRWDDWPASDQDYDLHLVDETSTIVASSEGPQSGTQPPVEAINYTNTSTAAQQRWIVIRRFNATEAPRFDLFVREVQGAIEYPSMNGDITEPGTSPSTFAVAAICWANSVLEPYSSLGPTIDGRIKPDISGQDSTSNSLGAFDGNCGNSGFTGTSAATPHVAGAAALVKQANPGFGPDQIQSFLESRAVDLNTPGKGNGTGWGALNLGAPPVQPVQPLPQQVDPRGCTIFGDENDNVLVGTPGNDVICAGGGNDTIQAGLGNDTVYGGNDGDTINGGPGQDRIFAGSGGDRLIGGDGVDRLFGEDGGDVVNGGGGSDVLQGGRGGDRLLGGLGGDKLTGGPARDTMFGHVGNDRFFARDGKADRIVGGEGRDRARIDRRKDKVREVEILT